MYATLSDVEAYNAARTLTATSIPNTTQVQRFLELTAAELDAILIQKGYALPIATEATGALLLLAAANAKGAWMMTERSSPSSPHLQEAQAAWEDAKNMLRAADQVMEASKNTGRSQPRGPGQTTPPNGIGQNWPHVYDPSELRRGDPTNDPRLPYFSRQQHF